MNIVYSVSFLFVSYIGMKHEFFIIPWFPSVGMVYSDRGVYPGTIPISFLTPLTQKILISYPLLLPFHWMEFMETFTHICFTYSYYESPILDFDPNYFGGLKRLYYRGRKGILILWALLTVFFQIFYNTLILYHIHALKYIFEIYKLTVNNGFLHFLCSQLIVFLMRLSNQ